MTKTEKAKRRQAMATIDEQAKIPSRKGADFSTGTSGHYGMGDDSMLGLLMTMSAVRMMARRKRI